MRATASRQRPALLGRLLQKLDEGSTAAAPTAQQVPARDDDLDAGLVWGRSQLHRRHRLIANRLCQYAATASLLSAVPLTPCRTTLVGRQGIGARGYL